MRVLFYLPVVTDRHYEAVVLPLIRVMARSAEVHVAGPPQWENTGLSERQLMLSADLADVEWHVLDGDDHPSLRTAPADPQGLIDFVRAIDPEISLCRSADTATPSRFPGQTRFMMEAAVPPFAPRPGVHGPLVLDGPRLYDQGFMPELSADERSALRRLFEPAWESARARFAEPAETRAAYLERVGLPADRRILALPLNVEAATNFFIRQHSATPSNAALVERLAAALPEDFVLALTRHPLNRSGDPLLDRSAEPIEPVVARLGERIRLIEPARRSDNPTPDLIRHCDGAIICDSKAFGYAAFFGKPMLRISRYESAPWLQAYAEPAAFFDDVRAGTASAPRPEEAMTWFAFHHLDRMFAAQDPELDAAEVIDRVERMANPARWEKGLEQLDR